ncbi:hypothetical protein LY78DRAFT_677945 [Colletotrichum sublineola]|nr:hypothetical protein LY78DRAFT_677945 [Colletotrichum sublineola]
MLMPADLTYFSRKHQRVQLALRADIAHFLILIPVTLRMGVATTHVRGGMFTILNEDTTTIYDLPAEKAKTDEKQAYGRKHMHAIMRQLVDILDVIKSTMTKTEIKTAVEKGREMQQREPAFGHPQSSFTSAYNDDNKDVFYLHTNNLIRYHSDSEKETWMGTPL